MANSEINDSFIKMLVDETRKLKIENENLVYILPNQRAGLYLKQELLKNLKQTHLLPQIITFDAFVESITELHKVSNVELLFIFFKVYKKLTKPKQQESFDSFSNWAGTLLNDFNEISINLVNEHMLFSDLVNINNLNNWNPNTTLTTQYFSFIENIENYYTALNRTLLEQKKAYQGLIFKESVSNIHTFITHTKNTYIFAGFYNLKTTEAHIIQELLENKRAHIYWSLYDYMLKDENPIGQPIRNYYKKWKYYKNNNILWVSNNNIDSKKIQIIAASGQVEMIKYLTNTLLINSEYEKTALVLPEQDLLPIVLNSLPKPINNVNITMGVPLKETAFYNLVQSVFRLHKKRRNNTYYYKNIVEILNNPLVQLLIKNTGEVLVTLSKTNKTYWDFNTLFSLLDDKTSTANNKPYIPDLIRPVSHLEDLLNNLISFIEAIKNKLNTIDKEAIYQHYLIIQKIRDLILEPNTLSNIENSRILNIFQKVYNNILHNERLNFIGEPLHGLQIMGFLETQMLDFDTLIITSLNEGILPKGKTKNSFLPYDLRKHYNLPTVEEQNQIEAYHFYRLLTKAKKVYLFFTSQTDNLGGGEKSQFITQLQWKYPAIKNALLSTKIDTNFTVALDVQKNSESLKQIKILLKNGISPSAFSAYLYNPIIFYQQYILKIYDLIQVEEIIEDNTLGTVLHHSLENLYKPLIGKELKEKYLLTLIKNTPNQVRNSFDKIYKDGQIKEGKNRLVYKIIINFIKRFLQFELRRIKAGEKIRILALEKEISTSINFPKIDFPIRIKGIVDRVELVDNSLRIIDYKSGKVTSDQLKMSDISLIKSDYKYSKALQVMLYAYLYTEQKNIDFDSNIQTGIISFKNLNEGFMPVYFSKKKGEEVFIKEKNMQDFLDTLQDLILEILNEKQSFIEKNL